MSSNRLASVAASVRLLKSFTAAQPTWGITALANHLALSKSTVHRIVSTLTDEGVLEQDQQTSQYRLGLAMFDLVAAVPTQRQLHEAVLLPMAELRARTGETVHVAVLDGRQVVYVERLDSPDTLQLFTTIGRRNDAHCTSTGKALLAFSSPSHVDRLLRDWSLPAKTAHTISSVTALRRELKATRWQGYAVNHHESEVGIVSLASPIYDHSGRVGAAISVAGPAGRMEGNHDQIVDAVVAAGRAASARLGYRGSGRR